MVPRKKASTQQSLKDEVTATAVVTPSRPPPSEEDEAAVAAAAAAEEAEAAARAEVAATAASQKAAPMTEAAVKKVPAGDIKARSLVDNPNVRMGGRRYNLRKHQTLDMNPSHATELSQRGIVVPLV